jgi:hypothetical protein
MQRVWVVVQYLRDHPIAAVGGVVAIGIAYYLLNLKPKFVRDADKRFHEIGKNRADYYTKNRPLR